MCQDVVVILMHVGEEQLSKGKNVSGNVLLQSVA